MKGHTIDEKLMYATGENKEWLENYANRLENTQEIKTKIEPFMTAITKIKNGTVIWEKKEGFTLFKDMTMDKELESLFKESQLSKIKKKLNINGFTVMSCLCFMLFFIEMYRWLIMSIDDSFVVMLFALGVGVFFILFGDIVEGRC